MPATRLTAKLYLRKVTAASSILWQSIKNTECSLFTNGCYPSLAYSSGMGLFNNWTKFRAAQAKASPVRVDIKMMIPVCERGASPSGVDDPRIIEYRSILIIIRLLINLSPIQQKAPIV